jgi:hypothetical protein
VREDLPRADGVQLLDAVEEEDPDLAPTAVVRHEVGGRVVVSGVVHG